MAKRHPVLRRIQPLLEEAFGTEKTAAVLAEADRRLAALCAAHSEETKAVKSHTVGEIYPCIALYGALQKTGTPKEEAAAFLDRAWSRMAEPKAASMRAMLKIPGLYRLMPRIFSFVAVHQFGVKAGFAATFYPAGPHRSKFDMTRCLYCDVCRREGCPELVPCFCHTDDVTDGHMHPRLCWNRTKTMGEGGDCCDFDLYMTEEK